MYVCIGFIELFYFRFVECGESSIATSKDAPSSRPVRRPLRDDEIETILNLGEYLTVCKY